jgi:CelD/BcsL family acetyltransferase involved in cellulose biosynthesis
MSSAASGVTRESFHEPRPILGRDLHCEFISDAQRLHELENDWRQLWLSLRDATPFQSPDWLLPWWKHYGEGQLFSFAFWDGDRLVGFAPLYIFRAAAEPRRKLFLLGTGNSDYLDVVFDPEFRVQCWRALVSEIRNRSASWDVCSFQRLRPGSLLLEEIDSALELQQDVNPQVPCVAIDLHDLAHGAVLLRRSQNYARKLQKVSSYSFKDATADTLDEFSGALERLHQERWHAEGYQGALSTPRDRSFHREVARRFLHARMLMFHGIRMAGKLIAVIYGYRVCDRIYSYLSGFDPEYAKKSVGAISIGYAVQRAIESGCHAFDFLQGQEPYKYTWGARDQACFVRRILKRDL